MTADNDGPARRYKLTLQYDGARFRGWQAQPVERTVQTELEKALTRLTSRPTKVVGAGRTDSGVHATGQVASAVVPARWSAEALGRALNAVLPDDVWVSAVEPVNLDFHARYDAVARGYVYRVGTHHTARSPFLRPWCWPLVQELDTDLLAETARQFIGTHSFKAFAKSGQPERGEFCTVHESVWDTWAAGLEYRVTANRFLHHMVRYMVGTMVDVGRGRRPAADVPLLLSGDPSLVTSPPSPAEGLFLTKVYYDVSELAQSDAAGQANLLPGSVPGV